MLVRFCRVAWVEIFVERLAVSAIVDQRLLLLCVRHVVDESVVMMVKKVTECTAEKEQHFEAAARESRALSSGRETEADQEFGSSACSARVPLNLSSFVREAGEHATDRIAASVRLCCSRMPPLLQKPGDSCLPCRRGACIKSDDQHDSRVT